MDADDMTAPSNAINLSYDVRRLAEKKMARAMDDLDEERQKAGKMIPDKDAHIIEY